MNCFHIHNGGFLVVVTVFKAISILHDISLRIQIFSYAQSAMDGKTNAAKSANIEHSLKTRPNSHFDRDFFYNVQYNIEECCFSKAFIFLQFSCLYFEEFISSNRILCHQTVSMLCLFE